MRAEFEEKSFEVAVNHELSMLNTDGARHHACPQCGWAWCPACGFTPARARPLAVGLWAPGQVLENLVNFDVAVTVDGDPDVLARKMRQLIPAGMDWIGHFSHDWRLQSASRWVSIFLQYKRPYFVERPQRKQKLSGHFAGPYFRFDLNSDQHEDLTKLSLAADGDALVQYCSPLFWRNQDLWRYRTTGLVLDQSAFIDVGKDITHKKCGYDWYRSVLCSEPEEGVPAQGAEALSARIREVSVGSSASAREALVGHISRLADRIRPDDIELVDNVSAASNQPAQDGLAAAVDAILDVAYEAGATWMLASVTE